MSTFTWKCPKCGYENESNIIGQKICYCGKKGCGRRFVVDAHEVTTLEVKVFELLEVK